MAVVSHRKKRTYRRRGRWQKRQDPPTGNNDVVNHLWDKVYGIMDKNNVLVAINKVHGGFGWVAAEGEGKSINHFFVVKRCLKQLAYVTMD